MKYLLTLPAGLESIGKKEIQKLWWNIVKVYDRLIFFEWEKDLIASVNLYSRVWNKLYIVLNSWENIDDFDKFYDIVKNTNIKKYYNKNYTIITKATSIRSTLSSTPTIQSITKKALVDAIVWKWQNLDEWDDTMEILSFLMEDSVYILLDTSWDTLYKRWYKLEQSKASIKENLAGGLVLLWNWRFRETLYDITCGAGTIAIEARMIARNIPPWLYRNFKFEEFGIFEKWYLNTLKDIARSKIYKDKYEIIASDIDKNIIDIARDNAKRAWVLDTIEFRVKSIDDYKKESLDWTLISNPPYWDRLHGDIENIHRELASLLKRNKELNWWIITWYLDYDQMINLSNYKKRKLYNWNIMTYFYSKKR